MSSFFKSTTILAVWLFSVTGHAGDSEIPGFDGWEKGEAHDTERRVVSWVSRGADQSLLYKIIKTTNGLFGEGKDSWSYKNTVIGDDFVSAANKALDQGESKKAQVLFESAAAHYGVARYPFIHSDTARKAYNKHNEAYYQFLKLAKISFEQIKIPFEDSSVIGNLYFPAKSNFSGKRPLVVVSGGIDTWKNELWATVKAMLDQGFLVFAMDMPGTGESTWHLDPSSERVYAAALDFLKVRPDVDQKRMAFSLRSFAGNFAVKLALIHPEIKAAINVAGPITFGDGELWPVPPFMLRTVGAGFGLADASFKDMDKGRDLLAKKVAALSLRAQGLLVQPSRQAGLLTINGTNDQLVPMEEIFTLSLAGIKQELWLYPGDGHCAGDNAHEYIPSSALWLKKQFDQN